MFHVVLFCPEIPQNAGNIVRLCAATGASLHLVGKLGFDLDDAKLKRAGLDYWRSVVVGIYPDMEAFSQVHPPSEWLLFSKKGKIRYDQVDYTPGSVLVFGPESTGLSEELLGHPDARSVFLPISPDVRSLNLAATVHVAIYEASRQNSFKNFP